MERLLEGDTDDIQFDLDAIGSLADTINDEECKSWISTITPLVTGKGRDIPPEFRDFDSTILRQLSVGNTAAAKGTFHDALTMDHPSDIRERLARWKTAILTLIEEAEKLSALRKPVVEPALDDLTASYLNSSLTAEDGLPLALQRQLATLTLERLREPAGEEREDALSDIATALSVIQNEMRRRFGENLESFDKQSADWLRDFSHLVADMKQEKIKAWTTNIFSESRQRELMNLDEEMAVADFYESTNALSNANVVHTITGPIVQRQFADLENSAQLAIVNALLDGNPGEAGKIVAALNQSSNLSKELKAWLADLALFQEKMRILAADEGVSQAINHFECDQGLYSSLREGDPEAVTRYLDELRKKPLYEMFEKDLDQWQEAAKDLASLSRTPLQRGELEKSIERNDWPQSQAIYGRLLSEGSDDGMPEWMMEAAQTIARGIDEENQFLSTPSQHE